MKNLKLLIIALIAVSSGFGGATTTFAQGDQLVTLCFRNRTIRVPFYLQSRYTANGATVGPCATQPPPIGNLLAFRKPIQRPSSKSTK